MPRCLLQFGKSLVSWGENRERAFSLERIDKSSRFDGGYKRLKAPAPTAVSTMSFLGAAERTEASMSKEEKDAIIFFMLFSWLI